MDIQMPDMNGVEATHKILEKRPGIGIIILTMLEDDNSLFSALQAGARGYVLIGKFSRTCQDILFEIRSQSGSKTHDGEGVFFYNINYRR